MGWAASIWRVNKCAYASTDYNLVSCPACARLVRGWGLGTRLLTTIYQLLLHVLKRPTKARVVFCKQSFTYGVLKVLLSGGTDNTADVTGIQYRFVAILIFLYSLMRFGSIYRIVPYLGRSN